MLRDVIEITILNWEKHNPKRDQKTYTWLRLNNDISTDPDLYGLDAEQKFVWIEILCQASRKNSHTINLNLAQISHITGVSRLKIDQLIEFITIKPIIEVHGRALPQTNVNTTPTYERNVRHETDETNVAHETSAVAIVKKPKKATPESANADIGKQASLLIARYCELWKEKYKTNISFSNKWAGNAKTLVKDHGLKRSIELVEAFMEMNDTWFIQNRHSFELILVKLAQITHYAGTGVQITKTQLNQIDKTSTNMSLLEKVKRGEA